ncbi:hypothetical protein LTR62_002465 [Meristemomyces frigidus]|uniref:Glycine zipper 2TM domain-containing protein n=1 Tax=Meristemomyces frigidus TaxID=1508187 RepID=A0AAN7TFR8_9PEZI|nr:hypothetical protein LTR62_002465 [Meristemomyces frigidus]
MTRYPPQDSYPNGDEPYGYQQQHPAGAQSGYGAPGEYRAHEGQGYDDPPAYQPPQYGEQQQGSAQGYYGSNHPAYQPYSPPSQYGGYENQQPYGRQPSAPGPPPGTVHHMPPPEYQQQYQYRQYAPPTRQAYGYAQPQGHYGVPLYGNDSSIEAFKSHYDQPHGPINPGPVYQQARFPIAPNTGQPISEGDRGLMGALAGGAAGAYGGHKINHGFLGGVGGAVVGSMLEDAVKKRSKKEKKEKKKEKKREKKKEKKRRRGSYSSSSSSSSSGSDNEHKHHSHGHS